MNRSEWSERPKSHQLAYFPTRTDRKSLLALDSRPFAPPESSNGQLLEKQGDAKSLFVPKWPPRAHITLPDTQDIVIAAPITPAKRQPIAKIIQPARITRHRITNTTHAHEGGDDHGQATRTRRQKHQDTNHGPEKQQIRRQVAPRKGADPERSALFTFKSQHRIASEAPPHRGTRNSGHGRAPSSPSCSAR